MFNGLNYTNSRAGLDLGDAEYDLFLIKIDLHIQAEWYH